MGLIAPDIEKKTVFAEFKDAQGRYRTQSLFFEMNNDESKYPSYFTLKPYDHEGRISMRRKYLEVGDPTEYTFAIQILGFWQHWQKLIQLSWFIEHVEEWRRELQEKISAQATMQIIAISEAGDNSSQCLSASKWLAEKKYRSGGESTKRGRPSKQEIEGNLKRMTEEQQTIHDDAMRIGLVTKEEKRDE